MENKATFELQDQALGGSSHLLKDGTDQGHADDQSRGAASTAPTRSDNVSIKLSHKLACHVFSMGQKREWSKYIDVSYNRSL